MGEFTLGKSVFFVCLFVFKKQQNRKFRTEKLEKLTLQDFQKVNNTYLDTSVTDTIITAMFKKILN